MAFIPMKSGGGGAMSETVLWTNSSPTSSFSAQAVTLSDDMNNYTYLKVCWRMSTSDSTSMYILIPVAEFVSYTNDNNPYPAFTARITSIYVRRTYYISDTSMQIISAYQMGGTPINNNYVIPTEIYGVK